VQDWPLVGVLDYVQKVLNMTTGVAEAKDDIKILFSKCLKATPFSHPPFHDWFALLEIQLIISRFFIYKMPRAIWAVNWRCYNSGAEVRPLAYQMFQTRPNLEGKASWDIIRWLQSRKINRSVASTTTVSPCLDQKLCTSRGIVLFLPKVNRCSSISGTSDLRPRTFFVGSP